MKGDDKLHSAFKQLEMGGAQINESGDFEVLELQVKHIPPLDELYEVQLAIVRRQSVFSKVKLKPVLQALQITPFNPFTSTAV